MAQTPRVPPLNTRLNLKDYRRRVAILQKGTLTFGVLTRGAICDHVCQVEVIPAGAFMSFIPSGNLRLPPGAYDFLNSSNAPALKPQLKFKAPNSKRAIETKMCSIVFQAGNVTKTPTWSTLQISAFFVGYSSFLKVWRYVFRWQWVKTLVAWYCSEHPLYF